ncbi:MAG TPA: addiction module protein [Microcella sp.]|nr:addiction module protein [Microcella sp.]
MNPKLTDYVEAGYALTPEQRLEAARLLRLSVDRDIDADQSAIDAAWDDEIARRLSDVVERRVDLVDGRTQLAQLRAEIAARRA